MNQPRPLPPVDRVTDPVALIAEFQALWSDGDCPQTLMGEPALPLRELLREELTKSSTENPYWDIVLEMPTDKPHALTSWRISLEMILRTKRGGYKNLPAPRDVLVSTFAWAIPSPGDLAVLTAALDGRAVVEIGAGTGYWAWQLNQRGVDVDAYDIAPGGNYQCHDVSYYPVKQGGPDQAARYPDRALMLCWPPYTKPMAYEALRAHRGDMLIYIGEGDGGCTADDDFHKLVNAEWKCVDSSPFHINYYGINSAVVVYRRLTSLPPHEREQEQ